MNNTPSAKKELKLDFTMSEVKRNIDSICEQSQASYQLKDKNDIFHTYRIAISEGLNPGVMNITLTSAGENQTEAVFETSPMTGSKATTAALMRMQDEFLNILSKGLSGEEINYNLIKLNKSGCLGIILFLSIASALFFSCSRANNTTDNSRVNGDYYFKLKANAQAIEHSGDYLQSGINGVEAHRALMGSYKELFINAQTGVNNLCSVGLISDSVRSGQTYTINDVGTNGLVVVKVDGKLYQTLTPATASQFSLIINIIDHSGGWISGTFSGKLGYAKPSGGFDELTITDGSFKTRVTY